MKQTHPNPASPGHSAGSTPASINTRADLASALRDLRENSGVTFRELVDKSGGLYGTVSGWFSGHHVPTKASAEMFDAALRVCGVDDPGEREEWWNAVGRARTSPARRAVGNRSPYKGLETFDVADAELFFGRGDVVAALTDRIRATAAAGGGVVAVLGASGSGKSSVLRAGLARSLPDVEVQTGIADSRRFVDTDAPRPPVIVFDQLEELWTLASETERVRFFDAVAARPSGTVFVFGLRSDFYRQALEEEVLANALVDNPIVVGRLRPDQLREVIVEPARAAGMTVDDALLRALTAEMEPTGSTLAHDHGALPMLSHALLATWQSASGTTLTVDDYYATGGLPGAVQQTAEKVFSTLSSPGQVEARRIFERLVNIDGEVLTRRRVARVELFRDDDSDGDVDEVLESFTASRLLTIEEESVSVTHEALLTAWDRLRQWIDDDREWHLAHRRLTDAAASWDLNGRDTGGLLPASRLESLQSSVNDNGRGADLNTVERDYLTHSAARVEHGRTQRRRRRRVLEVLTGALAIVTVLAVTLSVVAFSARSDADDRRIEAEAALAGQVAGSAERLRELDPGLSVNLALAAYQLEPTTAARSALIDASAIHAPIRLPGVSGAAVSRVDSTGSMVATGGADGVVRLWSVDEQPVRDRGAIDLSGPGSATAVEFSPTDPVLAVGGGTETSLWNVADADASARIATLAGPAKALAFSPDGTLLAQVSPAGAVSVWDITAPEEARPRLSFDGPSATNTVEFSPDGRFLVTAGAARALQVWDTSTFARPFVVSPPDGSTYDYLAVTFSPDGRSLAAGTTGREVARWSVGDRGELTALPPLTGFTSYVNDVDFDSDGSELIAVSSDNSIRTWDVATGAPRKILPGSTVLSSVAFAPDDSMVITSGQDGITRLWPWPGPVMGGQTDTVFVNPIDGSRTRLVAGVGAQGDGLRLWDVTNPDRPVAARRALSATTDDRLTGAAAMSWDGRVVAGGTASGGFQLWDVQDQDASQPIGGPHAAVKSLTGSLAFTRSGDVLAVSPQNTADMSLWDVSIPSSPRILSAFDVGDNPTVVAFSPDGRVLAVPTLGDVVELMDVTDPRTPTLLTVLDGFDNDANAVAFSPDGRLLAAASADRTVLIWDVADPSNPRLVSRADGPRAALYSIAFDPSGTMLAAGAEGGALWMWDIEDPSAPQAYATLTAYGQRVFDAVFGTDGAVVFGGGSEKDLRAWRTDPETVKERICSAGGLTLTPEEWSQYLPAISYRELC